MTWAEMLQYSADQRLLAKALYLVQSKPVNGLGPVLEVADEHVEYQRQLERRGTMFAAGPIATADQQRWEGEGVFMYRANSLAEATAIAEADPMHQKGARRFEIRAWLLNEGNFGIDLLFSENVFRVR